MYSGNLRHRVVVHSTAAVAQCVAGDGVGARRTPDTQIDAAGVGRLEQRELLGHYEWRVVGQHHSAGAHAHPLGGRGHHRDQQGRVGRGHRWHVVMLGQPVAAIAGCIGDLCQPPGGGQRVAGGLVVADGHEVKDGEVHAPCNAGDPPRLPDAPVGCALI